MPSGVDTKKPESQPTSPEHGGQRERGGRLEFSGGDGPKPLGGMQPVLFYIANVVDEIDRGAYQTERDEGQRGPFEDCWLEQLARGERRGEHEEVLDPLTGSHGADRGRHSAAANGNLRGFGHQDATLASHWECRVSAAAL